MWWNSSNTSERKERPPPLGGGPQGLGDPNDRRLRKLESDVIVANKAKEEAKKRCADEVRKFLDCVKGKGMTIIYYCREENNAQNECMINWLKNPDFMNEVTEKYIDERNHYRRTGKRLNPES